MTAFLGLLSACDPQKIQSGEYPTEPSRAHLKKAAEAPKQPKLSPEQEAAREFRRMAGWNFVEMEGVVKEAEGRVVFSDPQASIFGSRQAIADTRGTITVLSRRQPNPLENVRCQDDNGDGRWETVFALGTKNIGSEEGWREASEALCTQTLMGVVSHYRLLGSLEPRGEERRPGEKKR